MPRIAFSGSWVLVLAGAAALLLAALTIVVWPFTVDDTFITLRYADHLARGWGLVYNPGGPPVEGYTSVVWLGLLALGNLFDADALVLAKALGVACAFAGLVAAAALAAEIGRDLSPRARHLAAACAPFMLAFIPGTAIHAVSGMETALFTLLLTTHALFALRARRRPTPRRLDALAGLGLALGLTRPEGNLFAGVVAATLLLQLPAPRHRRFFAALVLLHVLPGAIYFGWRAQHFGQLLPLPFYVKGGDGGGWRP